MNASKTDKIVADATRILNDSKGRVKDDKVRAALENAIKSKDGKTISDAVKAVNDSIKAKSDADAKARAEKEKQAADNAAQAQTDNSGSYTGDTTGGYTGYTGGGYTQSQGGGGYTYTPQQSTGGSTGGGYTPTPQPQPQQPSQSGGGDGPGTTDICWAVDTSGKPASKFPAVNLSFSGARATHPMKIGCVTLVFYGTVVSACLFSRSRMRRIRCLRIRSIGMKKPRTAQPKEPVSDCSWCCFLRKIRFLASSPRL